MELAQSVQIMEVLLYDATYNTNLFWTLKVKVERLKVSLCQTEPHIMQYTGVSSNDIKMVCIIP